MRLIQGHAVAGLWGLAQGYGDFLALKRRNPILVGRDIEPGDIHPHLFDWQRDIVAWAAHKGRAAIFLDTGLGKTFIQLEWARLLAARTLIIAPLSVARQTVREAAKIGIVVTYARTMSDVVSTISITNYELVGHFDLSQFGAVVLDESSILKSFAGVTRQKLTEATRDIPYRLCCTATPAPNDYIELGNHAEFLGICSHAEMLATFFINANKEHTVTWGGTGYRRKGTNKGGTEWRLKHHAEAPFFQWLSTWAMSMTLPSDLGYNNDGFVLPPLHVHPIILASDHRAEGSLLFGGLHGISDRVQVRRTTIDNKIQHLGTLLASLDGQTIIWCGLDAEAAAVIKAIRGAIEVKGSDSAEYKTSCIEAFQDGAIRVLVTKPKIAGFGMNFQNACNMVFVGLNDSWETFYQAVRREWRYGQCHSVNVYVLLDEAEQSIYQNVIRKQSQADRLRGQLIKSIKGYSISQLEKRALMETDYEIRTEHGDNWTAMMGDAAERIGEMDKNSVDLSVYSPPFADLFTYTASARDLGNSADWPEFFGHYAYIIRGLLRVTKPGRLTCVHTSDIPAMAQRDGYIGVRDFPGEVIRAYEREGWVFVGRAFVQKNPQAQAIRVKSKALLFVQLRKDSSDSRPALVDQILLFRKPGINAQPVTPVANGELDNETWIEWAHGIWLGVRETETLQYCKARGMDDEKHICPLQLGVIERCIKLYSNPGETVLTPFGGIGSEAYMAIKLGRKAVLIELKAEYYDEAVKNLQKAEGLQVARMAL